MLLLGAMLVGSYVLIFFGLSLAVVKIAGGLVVTSTAWHLFRAEQSEGAGLVSAPAAGPPGRLESVSFYPLTFPLTVGPGSISVAVTVGAGARVRNLGELPPALGVVVGLLIVAVIIYLCYRYASRVLGVLGSTGTVVLLRLSAFILLSVGVQIFTTGVIERFGLTVPAL
jgi:multiple antibiotic resistance protein